MMTLMAIRDGNSNGNSDGEDNNNDGKDDNIYCVSMYLKSAIVGMNNNLLPLTIKQAILSKRY
jgi:hypothetical protein